ncbi:MAG: DUF1929 domain-containing protein [Myxococcota bacterium]|nr:DUF1929 domain-containing protein [Myxococcota bacterium]
MSSAEALTQGPVALVAKHSGKCFENVAGLGVQNTCTGSASQLWQFNSVTGGFEIVSVSNPTECLNLPGGSITRGTQIAISPCTSAGAAGQIWNAQAAGTDFHLVNVTSALCMDVTGARTAANTVIEQWTCSGALNQTWTLAPAAPSDAGTGGTDSGSGGSLGAWSAVVGIPSIAVAAAALTDGRVLTWASWQPDAFSPTGTKRTFTEIFDPSPGVMRGVQTIVTQTSHDMFCPGTARLADGRILAAGGGAVVNNTSTYDPSSNSWTAEPVMSQGRWYAVSVTLPSGDVFTLGGNRRSGLSGTGEIFTPGVGWKTVPGAVMGPIETSTPVNRSQEHPRLFVAPNGKIFVPGPTPNMQWYDLTGNGSVTSAGPRGDDGFSQNDSTAMYDVGKLLKAGGNPNYDGSGSATTPSSTNAYLIDINGGGTASVKKIAPLRHRRAYATPVILPDQEVLLVGGLDNGKAFTDAGAVLTPEIFNPNSETWTDLAPMTVPRTYHGVALLLPDARVFVAGGGLCGHGCTANHSDVQIFSPPYLFLPGRPSLTGAPGTARYGATFSVTTTGTVTRFSWIRMSTVTHTVNTDQRWLAAASTAAGGGSFRVTAPANANVAPPGDYYLFALNGNVPSVAKVVRITP